ncbi:MAG: endonuclease V [Chloroflexota bacterium]
MDIPIHHRWDLSRDRARQIQASIASEIVFEDQFSEIGTVAGIHIGYGRTRSGAITGRASVVVVSLPDLEVLEQHHVRRQVTFPHMPDLLSFREVPLALAGLGLLAEAPDLLMVESASRCSPNILSVSGHLGVLLDLPAVCCANISSRQPSTALPETTGSWLRNQYGSERATATLRTRAGYTPMQIAPGHRVSLESAVSLVMQCTRGFRVPEPLRLARQLTDQWVHSDENHGAPAAPWAGTPVLC